MYSEKSNLSETSTQHSQVSTSKTPLLEPDMKVCSRCIMDETDPAITFNSEGVCNHCDYFDRVIADKCYKPDQSEKEFQEIIEKIKKDGEGKPYDCIVGISGGVDSTYTALKVKEYGLRPLAVHFDSGWNSELAVKNIENIIKKLDIDLFTFVVDWDEMRDLQLAFFKASLANCDIPTDHGFVAVLYDQAEKNNINYIISGSNFATESILPFEWGYDSKDAKHLLSVQNRFGTMKLKNYPIRGFWKSFVKDAYFSPIEVVRLLNYHLYDKDQAKKEIAEKLNWRDYGGKHYESVFTRFFQGHYLPHKFGFDKRKAHLSSMVLSGQISREAALAQMQTKDYPEELMLQDKEFVAKKLGLTVEEFDKVIELPNKTFRDYPSHYDLVCNLKKAKATLKKLLPFKNLF